MFSVVPPNSDITRSDRHFAFAPKTDNRLNKTAEQGSVKLKESPANSGPGRQHDTVFVAKIRPHAIEVSND
jgi:hypothetical protein